MAKLNLLQTKQNNLYVSVWVRPKTLFNNKNNPGCIFTVFYYTREPRQHVTFILRDPRFKLSTH